MLQQNLAQLKVSSESCLAKGCKAVPVNSACIGAGLQQQPAQLCIPFGSCDM